MSHLSRGIDYFAKTARFSLAARSIDERYRRFAFEPRRDFHSAFPGIKASVVTRWVGGGEGEGGDTGRAWCSKLLIFFYIITRTSRVASSRPLENASSARSGQIRTVHFSLGEKEREREREGEREREEAGSVGGGRRKIDYCFVLWRSCKPGRRVDRKVRARVVVGDVEDVSRTLYIVL